MKTRIDWLVIIAFACAVAMAVLLLIPSPADLELISQLIAFAGLGIISAVLSLRE